VRANNISNLICESTYDTKYLLKNKIKLEPEERKEAMDRGCVWHMGGQEPSCGIWKAKTRSGEIVYGCNTHRAIQVKPTLKGAVGVWPFIKSTA
jgi:hypothetical protein